MGPHLGKKQKVFALVERGGPMRAFHVERVTQNTLKPILEEQVAKTARLMTDSSLVYRKIAKGFKSHETVNHHIDEYVRGDVTTNTVEGFFSVLKRGITGTYQHCSSDHLHRYVSEFSFRYNHRASIDRDDMDRTRDALKGIEGKRLTYR